MELLAGQTLGDYEILGILGAGGMGKVYQVRNRISGRVEAIKILLPDLNAAPELVDRFLREIRISASLEHPNIAALRTALRIDNQLVMVMEFVEGSTLDSLMKQGKIPAAKGIDYMKQALAALKYAHGQGVVHRDIKPGNMMLMPSGTLKLMDFGIAKMASDPKLTKTGLMVGSVYYMSPEQIEGKDLDGRSDLYSLGITLYQLVTGRRPFEGDSEYQIMAAHLKENPPPPHLSDPTVPAELSDIIMLAMAKDPAQRFQTAEAFQNALSAVGAPTWGLPNTQATALPNTQAAPPVMPAPPAPAQRNNRLWYMLAGSAATLAVIVAGIVEIPKYMQTGAAGKPQAIQTAPAPGPASQPTPAPSVVTSPATSSPAQEPRASTPGASPLAQSSPVTPTTRPAPGGPVTRPQAQPSQAPSNRTPATQQSSNQAPATQAQNTAIPQPTPPATQTPPQTMAQTQPAQTAPPVNTAEVAQLQDRANLMMARVGAIRTSFQNLQRQQAASGLSPRSDMVAADQRMGYQLEQAEASLRQGDSVNAKKRLDAAERDLEKLESFLGK